MSLPMFLARNEVSRVFLAELTFFLEKIGRVFSTSVELSISATERRRLCWSTGFNEYSGSRDELRNPGPFPPRKTAGLYLGPEIL